jgi:hypothetical protein
VSSILRPTSVVVATLIALGATLAIPRAADAWGTTGHREINLVAMRALPTDLPDFLETQQAILAVEALGPEEDRLKGSGFSWDHDNDPAHYVDISDNGEVAGVLRLHALPDDMEAYETALAAVHTDPYRVGYLPYAIADGWEQLRQDFAYWQVFDYLARHASVQADRAAYAQERALRQDLIVHDIGVWGHFVGDGSQPLHTTIHFNGWGKYPNPNHYTQEHIHAPFEGDFVRDNVTVTAVAKLVPQGGHRAPDHLLTQHEIMEEVATYLDSTWSMVPQLYTIEKQNGFKTVSQEAIAFATARVADGARELRDLVVEAYDDSSFASVGYPEIPVQDILSGKATPAPTAFGGD